jgi:hypothetical protein
MKNLSWVPPNEVPARWWVAVGSATARESRIPGAGIAGAPLRAHVSGAGTAGATLQGLTCDTGICGIL